METLLTHAAFRAPETLGDIPRACKEPLTRDERVLRDLAFSHLTRQDLLNLLTRRLWDTLKRRAAVRWGRRRRPPDAIEAECDDQMASSTSTVG